ncbi:MAG: hypothetical protein ACN4GW_16500 [Desulforhopalus sp.]
MDCTLILPWGKGEKPEEGSFPIIGWANGWGWNEVQGEDEIDGYKPGLIDWAVKGQFIVIAANQWSPRERDVLQCVAWLVEESDYSNLISKNDDGFPVIGLSGHSQGWGAVLRAADGKPKGKGLGLDLDITTVIAMNPYGPSWNEVNPDGPVLIVGGAKDTTTPPDSYEKAWRRIITGESGGINAMLEDGDHNNNAWVHGESGYFDEDDSPIPCLPEESNFGNYQELTLEWWLIYLRGKSSDVFCFSLGDELWLQVDSTFPDCPSSIDN